MDSSYKLKLVEESPYIRQDIIIKNHESKKILKPKPYMIDLFCGAGGFSVGAELSGFHPILGLDYFEPAMKTWEYNHPDSISVLGNIKDIDPIEIKTILKSNGVNNISLITGGVPCQGFSLANRKRHANDERNFLFIEYMKYIKVFKPQFIILENVSGMKSTNNGQFVKNILSMMDELGYNATVDLLNAADYGVPQIRKRIIFVGINREFADVYYKFPRRKILKETDYLTVKDAISDLPELNNNQTVTEYNNNPKTEYQKIMRGEGELSIKKPLKLANHTAPNHTKATIEKIKQTKQGKPMYEKYKQRIRLSNHSPSPTQLAGGIRPQFQFGHPEQNRGLSIRERARIQSFPDSYIFKGGLVQERVQTGNAVPPLLVYEITKPLFEFLEGRRDFNV